MPPPRLLLTEKHRQGPYQQPFLPGMIALHGQGSPVSTWGINMDVPQLPARIVPCSSRLIVTLHFHLRVTDTYVLTPMWSAPYDTKNAGCLLVCFHSDGNMTRFCSESEPALNLGNGKASAYCTAGDLEMARHEVGDEGEVGFYMSGSVFGGPIDFGTRRKGKGNAKAEEIACRAVLGCGFVGLVSINKKHEMTMAGLEMIGPVAPGSLTPASYIASISPSPRGIWISGYLLEGTNSAQESLPVARWFLPGKGVFLPLRSSRDANKAQSCDPQLPNELTKFALDNQRTGDSFGILGRSS